MTISQHTKEHIRVIYTNIEDCATRMHEINLAYQMNTIDSFTRDKRLKEINLQLGFHEAQIAKLN